jgi:benzoyl-CoA reductase subunit C
VTVERNGPAPAEATSADAEALERLLARCRDLHYDTDFRAVQAWKDRTGGRAFGYLPIYIPGEILHAVGALPVGIIGGGDRTEVIRGDAYFQSYICRIPRSTVELGLMGKLDVLDGMLFPAICDVIRNLSGVWKLLFPEKLVRFVDFPQNFDRAVGGRFYREQLEGLLKDISELTGVAYDPENLRKSIAVYNENRRLIRELHRARAEMPERVSTYDIYLVQRAGQVLPPEEHNPILREYLELARKVPRPEQDNARVVLVGAFCEQPPLALIKSLELAGCYLVDDDFLLGNRFLTRDVAEDGDPLGALVDTYLSATQPCSSVYDAEKRRPQALVERVKATRADGVLFATPSFCDPALLDRPLYQKALDAAGVPYTTFKYAENTGQLGAIREQVGTFSESIRLWGDAVATVASGRRNR